MIEELEQKSYETVKITTEFIRLDSFLKFAGLADTGGHAKILIEDGLVAVDGETCTARGKKLYPGNFVQLEDILCKVVDQEVADS